MTTKILIFLFTLISVLNAQWQNTFTSSQIDYNKLAGWLNFEKNGESWMKRMYTLDSTQFVIYADQSNTPEYVYTFNQAEILAGLQLYSVGDDVNNDGKMDFYVLSYYGISDYRQGFKIFDIITGQAIFEKNEPSFYFSYPTVADINNDGILDCIVTRFNYPMFDSYCFEIYSTGTTGMDTQPVPLKFGMSQNFPNPFNPSTKINFTIDRNAFIQLRIFNLQGEEIRLLKNEFLTAGTFEVTWDGKNNQGVMQPSGVYFYQMNSEKLSETKKMILLK